MKYFLLIGFLLVAAGGLTQPAVDSAARRDSLVLPRQVQLPDSLLTDTLTLSATAIDSIRLTPQFSFTSDSFLYRPRLFYRFTSPVRYTINIVSWQGKEVLFYVVVALLLFFAFIRNSFSKYVTDLFTSYFRTTVRQKQVKEQLLQSPLPSLLFNFFFIVSAAVFFALLFVRFNLTPPFPFWLVVLYTAGGLAIIYGGKYLVLKFFGWVFQMPEATNTYIFIVFSTNKVIGVLLLPFTVLVAFTYGGINATAVTLGLLITGALLAYRYFLSFISLNRQMKVDIFHFLIYLAALEVLPLLLINKLLLTILRELS